MCIISLILCLIQAPGGCHRHLDIWLKHEISTIHISMAYFQEIPAILRTKVHAFAALYSCPGFGSAPRQFWQFSCIRFTPIDVLPAAELTGFTVPESSQCRLDQDNKKTGELLPQQFVAHTRGNRSMAHCVHSEYVPASSTLVLARSPHSEVHLE